MDPAVADFWDRQTTENAELLREIAAEFNAGYSGLPINVVQSGNYADISTKTSAAITPGTLPSMAVAYGNTTLGSPDAWGVAGRADRGGRRMHGDIAYCNVNRQLNYANFCALSCTFCSF